MIGNANLQREKLEKQLIYQEWNPDNFVDVEKIKRPKQDGDAKEKEKKVAEINRDIENRLFEIDKQ